MELHSAGVGWHKSTIKRFVAPRPAGTGGCLEAHWNRKVQCSFRQRLGRGLNMAGEDGLRQGWGGEQADRAWEGTNWWCQHMLYEGVVFLLFLKTAFWR